MLLANTRRGMMPSDPSPYWNPQQSQQRSFQDFTNANQIALDQNNFSPQVDPKYDWAAKAAQLGAKTSTLNQNSALNATGNAANQAMATLLQQQQQQSPVANGSPRLGAIMRALRMQESGGNFGAVNKDSGALGGWQVMPSNIEGEGGWDMEALGRNISTEDFLNNRKLQRQIVRHKLGSYLDQHGLQGALSAWYSGSPTRWNEKTPQGDYPSVHQYVQDVLKLLGM